MKQRLGVFATLVFAGAFVSVEKVLAQSELDSTNGLTLTIEVDNWANISPSENSD